MLVFLLNKIILKNWKQNAKIKQNSKFKKMQSLKVVLNNLAK
jgi:hypothetical protein